MASHERDADEVEAENLVEVKEEKIEIVDPPDEGNGRLEFVCGNIYDDTTNENSEQLSSGMTPNVILGLSSLLSSDTEIREEHSTCNDSYIDTAGHTNLETGESKANYITFELKLNNDLEFLQTSKPSNELNISSGRGSIMGEIVDKSQATMSVLTSQSAQKNTRTQGRKVKYSNHNLFNASNILQHELSRKEIPVSEKMREKSNEIRQKTSCTKSRRMIFTASEQERNESRLTEKTYAMGVCESQSCNSERYDSVEEMYECKLSDRNNSNLSDLKAHTEVYPGEKRYQCKICNLEFTKISNLIKHTKVHIGETPFFMHQPMRIHRGEKFFNCKICEVKFTRKRDLQEHTRIHTGEKPFRCDTCSVKFTRERDLQRHIRIHTGENTFICEICERKFTKKFHIQEHMRTHTGEKPFGCEICSVKFTRKRDLQKHIRNHTGENHFLCDICGLKFTQKFHMEEHMNIHTGKKPFVCEICGVKFRRKRSMREHMIIHTGVKPFDCEICGVQLSRKRVLHKHMRKHTGEKPFNCEICSAKFARKDVLYIHMRKHTGEKHFDCKICGIKFLQKHHLQRHMNTHKQNLSSLMGKLAETNM